MRWDAGFLLAALFIVLFVLYGMNAKINKLERGIEAYRAVVLGECAERERCYRRPPPPVPKGHE